MTSNRDVDPTVAWHSRFQNRYLGAQEVDSRTSLGVPVREKEGESDDSFKNKRNERLR